MRINQLQPRGQKEKGSKKRSEHCHVPFVPCVCVFMKQEDNERLSVGASIMMKRLPVKAPINFNFGGGFAELRSLTHPIISRVGCLKWSGVKGSVSCAK
jgi:hypothetical protein